jgi:flavin reductase (DIM6/NTAB) family NADH-FMN oxidoreductase RutF
MRRGDGSFSALRLDICLIWLDCRIRRVFDRGTLIVWTGASWMGVLS